MLNGCSSRFQSGEGPGRGLHRVYEPSCGPLFQALAQELENKLVYAGSDNSVVYQRYYSLLLDCQYTLHWYPFDTQVCHLDITPASELEDFVQFEVESFVYEGPMDLTEYTIKEIDMAAVGEKLRVAVSIQRKLLSLILRTFIPTMILNIIGHMSNYYKESNFVGLMTLNVTVTLVLTTMFLSISTNLPPTAYIKMIDVWMIFTMLYPFAEIVLVWTKDFFKKRAVSKQGMYILKSRLLVGSHISNNVSLSVFLGPNLSSSV